MATVLFIDPNSSLCEQLQNRFTGSEHIIVNCESIQESLRLLKEKHVDVVILNRKKLHQCDETQFNQKISRLNPKTTVLCINNLNVNEIEKQIKTILSVQGNTTINNKKEERSRFFNLIFIMTMVVLTTLSMSTWSLYNAAIKEEKERLVEMAQTQARFIEAVGRFDAQHSRDAHPKGAIAATLSQVVDANQHINYHNPSIEFVLAKQDGDNIHFILQNGQRVSKDPSLFIETANTAENTLPITLGAIDIPIEGSALAEPDRRALKGMSGTDFLQDYRGVQVLAAYEPVMISGQLFSIVFKVDLFEVRKPFISAFLLTVLVSTIAIMLGAKQTFHVVTPVIQQLRREIEEREKAEQDVHNLNNRLEERVKMRTKELRELNHLNESILQAAGEGVCGLDLSGCITFANPAACKIVGYNIVELVGTDFHQILMPKYGDGSPYPKKLSPISMTLCDGGNFKLDHEFFWHQNDYAIPIEYTSAPILDEHNKINGSVVTFRNISARKQMEQALFAEKEEQKSLIKEIKQTRNQLLQNEKMAAIGQLAAGVAHEINNPIGYINSNLGSLQRYLDDLIDLIELYQVTEAALDQHPEIVKLIQLIRIRIDLDFAKEDVRSLVKESREGAKRVKQIVQDLKEFSYIDEAEWLWSDLHKGLDSTLNIVHNELKYKAEIVKEYGDIPPVECIVSQINQVFMNLLVNAAHAIEDRGTIVIRTGCTGSEVWAEVRDSGKGIPTENLQRIFDPFFTTKPVGTGTGLGLSLSYSIIKKHYGRIEVESEIDIGTCFRIWLPIEHTTVEENHKELHDIHA